MDFSNSKIPESGLPSTWEILKNYPWNFPPNQSFLVTGSTGFVGSVLCKILLELGHEVHALYRKNSEKLPRHPKLILHRGDLRFDLDETHSLEDLVKGRDAVFHVASKVGMWGSYEDFYDSNVLGTERLIDAMKKTGHKQKLIYTSTPSVVFDRHHIHWGDESLPYPKSPLNHYGKTKAMAESMVLNIKDFPAAALRPHLIYGVGDEQLIPTLLQKITHNRLARIGDGENLVDVTHIHNVIFAQLKLLEQMYVNASTVQQKAYFIGDESPVKLWDFIDTLSDNILQKKVHKKISLPLAYGIAWAMEHTYKFFRIKKDPPITRFIVLQLGKSHYFSHKNALNDFAYAPIISTQLGLEELIHNYRCRSS